jgi:hypothetical protein
MRTFASWKSKRSPLCPSFRGFNHLDAIRALEKAAVHQALRLKAAATDRSISEMVNDAVKSALTEDAEDLAAFDERKSERSASFESLVRDLRKRGRI